MKVRVWVLELDYLVVQVICDIYQLCKWGFRYRLNEYILLQIIESRWDFGIIWFGGF